MEEVLTKPQVDETSIAVSVKLEQSTDENAETSMLSSSTEQMDTSVTSQGEGSKKKSKAKDANRSWTKFEDPNAPRKPRSAYVHFLSSRRSFYGTAKQGCDQRRINVLLAAEWQALSTEDRQKYHDLSAKERLEYQTTLQEYQKTEQYATFMQKKELIIRQRKQCRKMGIESNSVVESMMLNMITPEEKTKKAPVMKVEELNFSPPMLPNTDIPIFSKEFLEYNKERENRLRQIRRSIGIAEDEQESMKNTIERLQANCDMIKTQNSEDTKIINDANSLMRNWIQLANTAIYKEGTNGLPDLKRMSNNEWADWISNAAVTRGPIYFNEFVKAAMQSFPSVPK
ncbi:unnamed protein product [Auanema sp. JU1783]|nr:unnamed protein product [Auanema sp. JU1783]